MNASSDFVQIPRLTVSDIVIESERLILSKNTYSINA